MSPSENDISFLETGLDYESEQFSPEEKATLLDWYKDNHDGQNTHVSRFPEFWIEHDPGGFKQYRRHSVVIDQLDDGVGLPQAAHLLMYLYLYTVWGNANGIFYLVVNARQLGATRAEVVDTFRLAALQAGPFGFNAAAELADQYLRDWPLDSDEPGVPWPSEWAADPSAFRSGIDHATDDFAAGELDMLRAWYLRVYGEVPSHVDLLAQHHPVALKTQRIKFETALGEALPVQLASLCMLLLAAQRQQPRPMLRAAQLAKSVGVRRRHVIQTLLWAGIYGGETTMEPAFDVLGSLVGDWE